MSDTNNDLELQVMSSIWSELTKIKDDKAAVGRVLSWLSNKLQVPIPKSKVSPDDVEEELGGSNGDHEFEDIAELTDEGGLILHFRDLKAKSKLDAANRLVHVVIYLHEILSKEKNVSSRKIVIPILRDWRVYDGNTRTLMAKMQGLHRKDDLLFLDKPAKEEAKKFLVEIRDSKNVGKWSPTSTKARAKRKSKEEGVEGDNQ